MISFVAHPYLFLLQTWLLVGLAMVAYFHTSGFTSDPDHKDLDLAWKIITALMWPICLVIFAVVMPYTVFELMFSKKIKTKTKKD